jgi:hypothetical protein
VSPKALKSVIVSVLEALEADAGNRWNGVLMLANTSESEVNRDRSQSLREGNDGNGDRLIHFSYFSHNAKIRKRF